MKIRYKWTLNIIYCTMLHLHRSLNGIRSAKHNHKMCILIIAMVPRTPGGGGGGGATAIERWTPCSFQKTRKKGRFSRTGDVRAYSGKGIKIAEIWKKGYTFQQLRYAFSSIYFTNHEKG